MYLYSSVLYSVGDSVGGGGGCCYQPERTSNTGGTAQGRLPRQPRCAGDCGDWARGSQLQGLGLGLQGLGFKGFYGCRIWGFGFEAQGLLSVWDLGFVRTLRQAGFATTLLTTLKRSLKASAPCLGLVGASGAR